MRDCKGLYRRYHYYDEAGVRHVVNVMNGTEPPAGCIPGIGNHGPEACKNIREGLVKNGWGPGSKKSTEHRTKMSEAKLGITKTDTHRNNMSAAHYEKNRRIKKWMELNPGVKYHDAVKIDTKLQKEQQKNTK
jgi:hypothetical protein